MSDNNLWKGATVFGLRHLFKSLKQKGGRSSAERDEDPLERSGRG